MGSFTTALMSLIAAALTIKAGIGDDSALVTVLSAVVFALIAIAYAVNAIAEKGEA